ncbi:pyruvate kinase [Pseudoflavonifractor phocaeensis]|uniref:pyruvate kinase n=1 Tax=Pseudoflavonifractor phocaeensis TaxID=1870988 RepID=UPI00313E6429
MRKTKIICTLGPAVDSDDMLRKLILSGMNCARFNFSHGTHESQLATLTRLKRVRDELGIPVAALMDTKGPEIRIKTFKDGPISLAEGDSFTLTTREVEGDGKQVSVTYANLHNEVDKGTRILIDDGLVELLVDDIKGQDIHCTVQSGGGLSNNKSINIPDTSIQLPALTDKDREDLKFAAENDFDIVAASFIRKASDIIDIREELAKWGGEDMRVMAKIENREGVDNFDEILEVADAIMVARGDLGVEIPAHEVPVIQKEMIGKCIAAGKAVITATQMLDSMIRNPRPTRAEVSDVANAVFDGTSCVMLSGETASGKYPIEALETMVDTVVAAEGATNYWGRFLRKYDFLSDLPHSINQAISHTCCMTAMDLDATAILAATTSGHTARAISRFKPACPIIALTTTEKVRRQLAITWGVHPFLYGSVDSTDRLFALCVESARKEGVIKEGDTVVITAGVPMNERGTTNLIKAQVVG